MGRWGIVTLYDDGEERERENEWDVSVHMPDMHMTKLKIKPLK